MNQITLIELEKKEIIYATFYHDETSRNDQVQNIFDLYRSFRGFFPEE